MKSLRVALLGLGILFVTTPAWAGQLPGTDPRIIIGPGSGSLPIGSTFIFDSPTGSSPVTLPDGSPCIVNNIPEPDCVFQNSTSVTFSSLTFDINTVLPPGSELGCSVIIGGPFTNCSFGPDSDGYFFTFTGGPGVAPEGDFAVSVEGWNPNSNFGVGANGITPPTPTPESGTMVLFLTGGGALALALGRNTLRHRHTS